MGMFSYNFIQLQGRRSGLGSQAVITMRCSQAVEHRSTHCRRQSFASCLSDSKGQTLMLASSPPLGKGKPLHMYLGYVGLTQQLLFIPGVAICCPDTRGGLEVHPPATLGMVPLTAFPIKAHKWHLVTCSELPSLCYIC